MSNLEVAGLSGFIEGRRRPSSIKKQTDTPRTRVPGLLQAVESSKGVQLLLALISSLSEASGLVSLQYGLLICH